MDKNNFDLSKWLKPLKKEDEGIWKKFLEVPFENVIWYPSSGYDFLDLIHTNYQGLNITGSTLFLHSDQLLQNELIDNMGIEERGQTIKINRITELKLTDEFKPEYDSRFLSDPFLRISVSDDPQKEYEMIMADLHMEKKEREKPENLKGRINQAVALKSIGEEDRIYGNLKPARFNKYLGKAFLLNIDVTFDDEEIKNKDLLYFSFDNISFFREFIIKNNIPVKTIVSVRDQMAAECREKFWKYLAEYSSIGELVCDNHLILGFEQNIINGTPGPANLIFEEKGEFKWNHSDFVRHFKIIRQFQYKPVKRPIITSS